MVSDERHDVVQYFGLLNVELCMIGLLTFVQTELSGFGERSMRVPPGGMWVPPSLLAHNHTLERTIAGSMFA